ncbi:hypothetical protein BDY21DRAFT_289575 [Lineolata rhizophorae]|uniref:DNA primase n=1 Tax=Lineolata rhizophorae TaxID=578093 RepID=A0A6A6NV52_9PEZI|nr:hypothetical protein BDY21DRAFT_289575 [Lineolata rhizophorae]
MDSSAESGDGSSSQGSSSPAHEVEKIKMNDIMDEESDDEFPSSMPSEQVALQQKLATAKAISPRYSDPDIMRAFYQRLYPFRFLFRWLNHSPKPSKDFTFREFAFTLQNDAYLRFQSFPTGDLLRKQCISMTPTRFEIGPVYSSNPRDRKLAKNTSEFKPLTRELVFDVDMDDYDSLRTCCQGAKVCSKCWAFLTMAIQVLDTSLRDDFGYEHILWVYSGRRGVHAWVCDRKARELDDSKRKAIAGYMELLKGGDQSGKKVNIKRPLHPHLQRSLKLLEPHFGKTILTEQDTWRHSSKADHLLSLLPPSAATLRIALQEAWASDPSRTGRQKWDDITDLAKKGAGGLDLDTKALHHTQQDIVLEYTYPRLDAAVSRARNHLLKAPFCVHPGTGRVCVPIDPDKAAEFDPTGVPVVTELLEEIDRWEAGEGDEESKVPDWDKTSLKPYVGFFKDFVTRLEKDETVGKKREREDVGESMEF